MAIISAVRQDKAEKKLPLNAPGKTIDIYSGSEENMKLINSVREDIAGTLKIANIRVHPEKRCEGRQISPYDVYFQIEY